MKKLMAMALALALLLGVCGAGAETAPALTMGEIENYLDGLKAEADAAGNIQVTLSEDGEYLAQTARGVMTLTDEVWSEAAGVVTVTLAEDTQDMRGITVGDSITDVLYAYPCDNAQMFGS